MGETYCANYMIRHIGGELNAIANKELKAYGLTMTQARIIVYLCQHDGCVTQKELEQNLGVSHPTVVNMVAQLEQDGYVSSQVDTADRRFKVITITDKARGVAQDLMTKVQAQDAEFLQPLNDRQRANLKEALQLIFTSMEESVPQA
jgi:MarR family transcriptional repressor of mepA